MHIIQNRVGENHLERVRLCFKGADEMIIVSPFLANDLNFFPFHELTKAKKITLITRLKPYSFDQYEKVNFGLELMNFGKQHGIEIEMLIDNFLHGKLYIAGKDGQFTEAIITSANFNKNGLVKNNEWGISITDRQEIEGVVQELRKNIFEEAITEEKLLDFQKQIEANPVKRRGREVPLNLIGRVKIKPNPLNIKSNTTYWLKPIGVTENWIPWGEPHGEKQYQLRFAKKPSGIRKRDIVIAFAVGYGNILSVYQAPGSWTKLSDPEERWKYYIMGENLTPYYGAEWHKHELLHLALRIKAINEEPFMVTPSGLNSFGSFNRGADKLRITVEFGKYLIQKIMEINKQISERPEV